MQGSSYSGAVVQWCSGAVLTVPVVCREYLPGEWAPPECPLDRGDISWLGWGKELGNYAGIRNHRAGGRRQGGKKAGKPGDGKADL